MRNIFEKLYRSEHLNQQEMKQLAAAMFEGELTDSQLASVLISLKIKGETSDELAGLAATLQKKAKKIPQVPANVMDNCGTGGDFSNSFNISTTTAFVLAGAGIPIAKHGNRSISSHSGSADLFEQMGIALTESPDQISYLLNEVGITFLYAPAMHPKMKYVMKVRKELATPTILNLIGPLVNPIPLETQLVGTYHPSLVKETAETLGKLGRRQALVVHGYNGMDEANLAGATTCAFLKNGKVEVFTFTPEAVGLSSAPLKAIEGGDAAYNEEILYSVLKNEDSPCRETVILNAALGFLANGKVRSIPEGIAEARTCLSSGAAYQKLQQLLQTQKEVA